MKECIDKMLVILPFEKDYYRNKWNWEVEYVGHPLVEVVEERQSGVVSRQSAVGNRQSDTLTNNEQALSGKPVVALLPGSRKQEILKKLPIMLEVSKEFPDLHFVVAKAPGQEDSFYDSLLQGFPNVSSVSGKTYTLLLQSQAALVTSGTATLETALFAVPEVVCYKGSNISYQIAKRLVKVKYISLVNLIMDKLVVKELIQDDLTPANLKRELHELLYDPARREQLQKDYAALKQLLSEGGHASAKAAASIVQFLDVKREK
jgi:lipid-A-disaccharide synthase